ncbi:MarR family transcriptional regulator [Microbacteriaceae bacterium K1510]|nr:MarR family transcriptional regulator [Microbacteriaceae bacterium K1510]
MAAASAQKTATKHTPQPDGSRFPEDYLGYQLARASHLVTSSLHDQFAGHGVSVPTWRILTSALEKRRTITEIGQLVLMKQSALSRALDRLERDGLIARKRSETERRLVYIELTPKGRKQAKQLRATAALHEKKIRQSLSTSDLKQLGLLLDRVILALAD